MADTRGCASEEWRPVVGGGSYEVSNLGRVRTSTGRMLGQWKSDTGYMMTRLRAPRRLVRVHRLVAQAFCDNPDGKPSVNHIDADTTNNASSNLEWCTQKENIAHADRLGRMCRDYWTGKRSPSASLSDDQVREMRRLYGDGGISLEAVGRVFGVSKRAAGRAISRETYADVQ